MTQEEAANWKRLASYYRQQLQYISRAKMAPADRLREMATTAIKKQAARKRTIKLLEGAKAF